MAQLDNDNSEEIRALAEEIATYFLEREQVADTLEGIARWWIMRQRLQEGQRKVALAMDYLCAQGVVTSRKLPDGAVLYTSSAQANVAKKNTGQGQDERGK